MGKKAWCKGWLMVAIIVINVVGILLSSIFFLLFSEDTKINTFIAKDTPVTQDSNPVTQDSNIVKKTGEKFLVGKLVSVILYIAFLVALGKLALWLTQKYSGIILESEAMVYEKLRLRENNLKRINKEQNNITLSEVKCNIREDLIKRDALGVEKLEDVRISLMLGSGNDGSILLNFVAAAITLMAILATAFSQDAGLVLAVVWSCMTMLFFVIDYIKTNFVILDKYRKLKMIVISEIEQQSKILPAKVALKE